MRPNAVPDRVWETCQRVAPIYGVSAEALFGNKKSRRISAARWAVWHELHELRRDNGTRVYGCTTLALIFRKTVTSVYYGVRKWKTDHAKWEQITVKQDD